ncbi:MAG: hypothetical protein KC621_05310 [Myxococcales bacterium]|nr:hypothetical protein [Myxococcales bacterium]
MWTDRPGVVRAILGRLDTMEQPARDRALTVLAALRCPDPAPFRGALEEAMARGERAPEWVDAFTRAGGRLTTADAERWLALDGRADACVAVALDADGAHAVFGARLAAADTDTLCDWAVWWRSSASGTTPAALYGEVLRRLLPIADPTVPSHRRALSGALPHPVAIRRLAELAVEDWPLELWQALRAHPHRVADELAPDTLAMLAHTCALPGDLLPSRLGGLDAARTVLFERMERIGAHVSAVATQREALSTGALIGGALGPRIKGGHHVVIGALTAFLPASRSRAEEGPEPRVFRVVKVARTVVVEPAWGEVATPSPPVEPVPLAVRTIETLVGWSEAAALLPAALEGPASEQVFDALRRLRPERAAAWVATRRPPHERGWRWRLELGAADAETEWVEALRGRAVVRHAALRGLRHRTLTPAIVQALRGRDGWETEVGALRLLAEAGAESWARMERLADDETQRPGVRGAALRCLPRSLALDRCRTWLTQQRLGTSAAEMLADLGDDESLTTLLCASLDPNLPCRAETLRRL